MQLKCVCVCVCGGEKLKIRLKWSLNDCCKHDCCARSLSLALKELLSANPPDSCFLTFQLGFGSFLGIIGAHLIENKRQMVRGFILPLCIEITLTSRQSESTDIKACPPLYC